MVSSLACKSAIKLSGVFFTRFFLFGHWRHSIDYRCNDGVNANVNDNVSFSANLAHSLDHNVPGKLRIINLDGMF